jgi:hypothetical protein
VPDDRRLHPRFPFHTKAVFLRLPRYFDVTLIDLSMNGALVELPAGHGLGLGLQGTLRVLSPGGGCLVETEVVVAHVEDGQRAGLRIASLSPGAQAALRGIMHMNLGTDRLLKRELCALLRPARTPVSPRNP